MAVPEEWLLTTEPGLSADFHFPLGNKSGKVDADKTVPVSNACFNSLIVSDHRM